MCWKTAHMTETWCLQLRSQSTLWDEYICIYIYLIYCSSSDTIVTADDCAQRGEGASVTTINLGAFCRYHDDVIKWKKFQRYWPFVPEIHRLPVNSPHKGRWRGAFIFSLICARINVWVNNREAGDLRHHRAHYDVIVMNFSFMFSKKNKITNVLKKYKNIEPCWHPFTLLWRHKGTCIMQVIHTVVFLRFVCCKYITRDTSHIHPSCIHEENGILMFA